MTTNLFLLVSLLYIVILKRETLALHTHTGELILCLKYSGNTA